MNKSNIFMHLCLFTNSSLCLSSSFLSKNTCFYFFVHLILFLQRMTCKSVIFPYLKNLSPSSEISFTLLSQYLLFLHCQTSREKLAFVVSIALWLTHTLTPCKQNLPLTLCHSQMSLVYFFCSRSQWPFLSPNFP